jgi:Thioredoxin
MTVSSPAGFSALFQAGASFPEFLERTSTNRELWHGIWQRASVPHALVDRIRRTGSRWRLLVLADDWCGDAVNSIPPVAKLVQQCDNLELRVIPRDENPDLMDAHLKGTSRSIPVIVLLDEHFVERGWWAPRPSDLQDWVTQKGLQLPKGERYLHVRRWYAKDRGTSTLEEIVRLVETAASKPLPE